MIECLQKKYFPPLFFPLSVLEAFLACLCSVDLIAFLNYTLNLLVFTVTSRILVPFLSRIRQWQRFGQQRLTQARDGRVQILQVIIRQDATLACRFTIMWSE